MSEKRASDILNTLEDLGILGPGKATHPREILVDFDQGDLDIEFDEEQSIRTRIARLEDELAEKRTQLVDYFKCKDSEQQVFAPKKNLTQTQEVFIKALGLRGIIVRHSNITQAVPKTQVATCELFQLTGVRQEVLEVAGPAIAQTMDVLAVKSVAAEPSDPGKPVWVAVWRTSDVG